MKRRDFIKMTSAASAAMTLNGLPVRTYGKGKLFEALAKTRGSNGNKFIFIELSGGNDGLNTVIPLNQYSNLSNARGNILIPQTSVLPLNGLPGTGLHPALDKIQTMYNNDLVNLVQGVSYPSPSLSHFRSSDIWYTASDSNQYLTNGWVGRSIDVMFPGAPQAYPDPSFTDPLAIQIGSSISPMLSGMNGLNGIAVSDIDNLYNFNIGNYDPAPNTPAGHELTFIRFVTEQTKSYTQVLQNAANLGTNLNTYPLGNRLGDALKMIARLISGGLETPIYVVRLGGFDTHDNQVDSTNPIYGQHASLLKELGDAIEAFYTDLIMMGKQDEVCGCTFSEFGRRILSNASLGSDHGVGAPMIFFGTGVNPAMVGTNPNIPGSVTVSDNVPMQFDFRQVYASILRDWFGISGSDTQAILNGNPYTTLPIFKNPVSIEETVLEDQKGTTLMNYPNPMTDHTNIRFESLGGDVQIVLYDEMGKKISVLYENYLPKGTHEVTISRNGLAHGLYYYELIHNGKREAAPLIVQ